jgi:hypothetical protein
MICRSIALGKAESIRSGPLRVFSGTVIRESIQDLSSSSRVEIVRDSLTLEVA